MKAVKRIACDFCGKKPKMIYKIPIETPEPKPAGIEFFFYACQKCIDRLEEKGCFVDPADKESEGKQ